MRDLTVVIPSIGRESLINSIKSVDISAKIVIGISKDDYEKLSSEARDYIDESFNTDIVIFESRLSPGASKDHLIRTQVYTKYVTIMDDDDQFNPGFLNWALAILEDHVKTPCWVTSLWSSQATKEDFGIFEFIGSQVQTTKKLFDYNSYTPEYFKEHIYPNSSTVFRTELYKMVPRSFRYQGKYGDDILPNLWLMSRYSGIQAKFSGAVIGTEENTVSRNISIDDLEQCIARLNFAIKYSTGLRDYYLSLAVSKMLVNVLQRYFHKSNG